jgi:CheY-like chemotaxis protein
VEDELEHDPEKWTPVLGKRSCSNNGRDAATRGLVRRMARATRWSMNMTTPTASPRILVVDDDPSIVRFLANRFTNIGFDVEIAMDGLQALALAGRRHPDIIVADVKMPKLGGLPLCECLVRTGGKRMLTIVISDSDSRDCVPLCNRIAASFAQKGPNLWATIERIIAKSFRPAVSQATETRFTRPR